MLPAGSCPDLLPDTEVPFVQVDGVSCGFHCLARMEKAFCEFRGQRLYRCYKSVAEIRKSLSAFVQTLLAFKRQQAKKALPPPLPPPPLEDSCCAAEAAVPVAPPPPILADRRSESLTCPLVGLRVGSRGRDAAGPQRGDQGL